MTAGDDRMRALEDRLELRDLVFRYARAVDRHDYPALQEIFTKNAHMSGYRGNPSAVDAFYSCDGIEAVIGALKTLEEFTKINHVVSNQLVEIDGDRATGETYGTTHFLWRENGVLTHRMDVVRYQDCYRREGAWQIEERRLVFDWEYDTPIDDERGWVAES